MPKSKEEAERIYKAWDRLNGRYYFGADIEVAGIGLLRSVIFDSDTGVAVEIDGAPVSQYPSFFGKKITRVDKN